MSHSFTQAVLNLPGSALERLAQSSVIFNDSSERARRWLGEVKVIALTKVYAWYEDAWWSSKMGLMEGYFNTTDKDSSAPLLGRYHDGPLRCVIGKDSAGASLVSTDQMHFATLVKDGMPRCPN